MIPYRIRGIARGSTKSALGIGPVEVGRTRANVIEALEITAAARVNTIKIRIDVRCGLFADSAMSMASRFGCSNLLGGSLWVSFYDWYADLPIASPQIWGDQTDVPER